MVRRFASLAAWLLLGASLLYASTTITPPITVVPMSLETDQTVLGVKTFPAGTLFKAGGGSGTVKAGGLLHLNVTPTACGMGAADLMSYTLPASTLNTTGQTLHVKVMGRTAANANTKPFTFNFGSSATTPVSNIGNNITWDFEAWIVRTGSSTQWRWGTYRTGTTVGSAGSAPTSDTQTDTGTIVIKISTSNCVAASDITQDLMLVELFN